MKLSNALYDNDDDDDYTSLVRSSVIKMFSILLF